LKVVLVGGLGYLGYHMVREIAGVHDVVVAVRRGSLRGVRRRLASEVEKLGAKVEVAGESITESFLESIGGDAYIHVAGKISGSFRAQWEAHVGLLERILGAASRLGSRVVYVSSILAFGRVEGIPEGSEVYEEEEHLSGRRSYVSHHSRTKAEGERLLVARGGSVKGKWVILRPGLLVGAWGYHLEWAAAGLASKLGLYPSAPWRLNVVAARDVARLTLSALEGALDGKWVHLVSSHPSHDELFGELCRLIKGSKCARVPVSLILSIAGRLAPPSTALSAVWEGVNQRYVFKSRYVRGFEWTPLEDALKELASWLKGGIRR
jgi:nucleoside-diphosphate-sugar epimerase